MPPEPDSTRAVRDAFLKLYAADLARGRPHELARYQSLFPGFEADIAEEFAHLDEGEPAPTVSRATPPVPETAADPTHIGPYRILSVLGEGGMGTVYLAEQREPVRRRVALKVIKLGMDSKQVLARFEAERQALAMMNHDNIARVFEAGTTERGQPFFVMEHVEGIPLTQYCDQHKLTIQERIELFQQACAGVQHAHQKGVIHRDLKPSNVLVTRREDKAIPKIIDFGLARATDQQLVGQTLFTEQGQVLGTPEYMSPEQAGYDAQGIDTRTDIYSLGVMLYELLAGELPFSAKDLRAAGMLEIQRKIREDQPPRPSTRVSTLGAAAGERADRRRTSTHAWTKVLRGDLDWVVLKAMAKEPERRYESATGLAMDLGRFLEHQPVLAGPPGVGYRVRKFVRRYRLQVGAAMLILLTLIAGIVGTAWFAVSAQEQGERARHNERLANQKAAEAEREKQRANDSATEAREEKARADRERDQAVQQSYVASVRSAELALETGWSARAREALMSCPPSYRGWEWHHLNMRTDVSLAKFEGHQPGWGVARVSCTPDGRRIVSASGELLLWDAASGEHQVLVDPSGSNATGSADGPTRGHVNGFAIDTDGSWLAAGLGDGRVILWDLTTGARLWVSKGHSDLDTANGGVDEIAFSPDGSRLVSGSHTGYADGTIRIWDTTSGALFHDLPRKAQGTFQFLAYSPDGAHIVSAGSLGKAELWDAGSGQHLRTLQEFRESVSCGAFSPDSTRIVFGLGYDRGSLQLLDAASGKSLATMREHRDHVSTVAFNRDGSRVVSTSRDGTAQLWNGVSGEHLFTLPHGSAVGTAAFSPDAARIVTGSEDRKIRLWSAASGELLTTLLGHEAEVRTLAFTPDGHRVISGAEDSTVRVWNVDDGAPSVALMRPGEPSLDMVEAAFGADGSRILAISRLWRKQPRLYLWNALTGELLASRSDITSAVFDSDGASIVAITTDGALQRLNAVSGELETTRRPSHGVEEAAQRSSVFCTAAGARILSHYADRQVRLWDATTDRLLLTLPADSGWVSVTPDGRHLVTRASDQDARVWDAVTGESRFFLPGNQSVAFSPDGRLVAAGADDGAVRLCDGEDGEVIADLAYEDPIKSPVYEAAFSPDGKLVLTRHGDGGDGKLRLWDVDTRTLVATLGGRLRGHGRISAAHFTPDGRRIVAALRELSELRIFDVATGGLLITLRGLLSPEQIVTSPDGSMILAACHGLHLWPSDLASARALWRSAAVRREAESIAEQVRRREPLVEAAVARLQSMPAIDDKVRRLALQIVREDPQDPSTLNATAWSVVDPDGGGQGDRGQALRFARAAVDLAPTAAAFHDTLAWALFANDLPDEALASSARALELAHDREKGDYRGHLARLREAVAGDQRLAALFAGRIPVEEFVASLVPRADLPEQQLAWARRRAALRLCARAGQGLDPTSSAAPERSLQFARGAVGLAPTTPNFHHALAAALAANGLADEARAAAARAREMAQPSSAKVFGFTSGPPDDDRARALGVDAQQCLLVASVNAGSTAEFAGLRAEDVITRVAGDPATTAALQQAKAERQFFETVPFEVRRGDETLRIDVPVGASDPK